MQTTRNADQSWKLSLLFHFETPDVDRAYTGNVDIRIWEPDTNQLILETSVFIQVTSDEDREASSAEFEFQIPDSTVLVSFIQFISVEVDGTATIRRVFCGFAAERLVRSSRMQKQMC